MRRLPIGPFELAVSLALFAGCASDDDVPPPRSNAEPSDDAVLEGCSSFAARLCASAAPCCESTGQAFSVEACSEAFVHDACRPAADVVAAGLATYHPETTEDCLAAYQRAHETCSADWRQIVQVRREVWSACKMIRGTVAAGRGCSTASSCAQPDGAGTARCVQSACRVVEILAEGAPCAYPNGEVSVCDDGLYCTAVERDMTGTCAPAVADGAACDSALPLNPECGLGSYCGLDDARCHRATNFGGPSCAQSTECVSFTCDLITERCSEAPIIAAELCASGA